MKFVKSALILGFLTFSAIWGQTPQDSSGLTHPVRKIVDSLNDEGYRLRTKRTTAAYDSARVLYDSALVLAEATFGPMDVGVAKTLVGLAFCDYFRKDSSQTEPLLKRALEIYRTALGENHEMIAVTLRLLGDHYWARTGEYQKAEQTYLQARQILNELPEEDIDNAYTLPLILNNLALLYMRTHRLREAESLLLEAIPAWEAATGPNSSWMGLAYENLADVYRSQKRFDEAEPLMLKALSLLEQTRGGEDAMVAECLGLLGRLYIAEGKYESAVGAGERQLAIWEATYGPDHREVYVALSSLAAAEKQLGDWDSADKYNDRCMRIVENWYGTSSGALAAMLIDKAKVYFMRGQADSCLRAFSRATAIRGGQVKVLFEYASEAQKLGFARDNPLIVDSYLSFAQQNGSNDAVSGALNAILHGKALVLDALAAEREIAYCSEDATLGDMVEQHNDVCSRIARFWLDADAPMADSGLKDTLDALYSVKDRLEADLSARCADFNQKLAERDFTVSDVSGAMPDGSILLEYVSYTPFRFKPVPGDQNWEEPLYAAFILTNGGVVNMINLGEVNLVDSLILTYRTLIREASYQVYGGEESETEARLSLVTNHLYRVIFAPLEKFIKEDSEIYISPYGMLNVLPFDLLATDDGRYLVEKYSISYLSSGRDFLKFGSHDSRAGNRALVIADPDYDCRPAAMPEPILVSASVTDKALVTRGPSDKTDCLADVFRPLHGTKAEGDMVAGLLRDRSGLDVACYFGESASESVIKAADIIPQVLHLATHGYYCDKAALSDEIGLAENPLLYSGLVLAGANRFIAGEDKDEEGAAQPEDGILTSLEASGLNLAGTNLVVLSACQSGVGSVLKGEGTYGLRRAFQLAGARSVVMSMFDVPDKATSILMERFYENWLSGQSKSSSLRKASLSILRERREANGCAHPLFWSGFILVGDPD